MQIAANYFQEEYYLILMQSSIQAIATFNQLNELFVKHAAGAPSEMSNFSGYFIQP